MYFPFLISLPFPRSKYYEIIFILLLFYFISHICPNKGYVIGRGQIVNELTIVNMYHIFDKKKKKQKHVPYLYVKKYIYITFSPIGYELDTRHAFYILIVQSQRELQSAFLSLRTQIIMYNGGGRRRDVEGRNGGGK